MRPVRVLYEAPLLDTSGYASMARAVVLGLDDRGLDVAVKPMWFAGAAEMRRERGSEFAAVARDAGVFASPDGGSFRATLRLGVGEEPHRIYLPATEGGVYEYRTRLEQATVERVLALAAKRPGPRDAYVAHTIPADRGYNVWFLHRWLNRGHGRYVGSTMCETIGLPWGWAEACNGMDEVWVPSEFNRETFAAAGVARERLHVLPLGIDAECWHPARVRPLALPHRRRFVFLSVFQWTLRKGWDVLLRAYLQAFQPEDDVTLVLRASLPSRGDVGQRVAQYIVDLGHDPARIPDVVVLDEPLSASLLPALYAAADAFVLPSRGEGWGLPYLEAMAMAKPTIGTRWSGNLDFMTEQNAFLVDVDGTRLVAPEQVDENPLYEGLQWGEPSVGSTAALMRRVFEDPAEARRRAARAREDVTRHWTLAQQAARVAARLEAGRTPRPRVRCGAPARALRVLFQNRPNARTNPGGDTLVMDRLRRALEDHGDHVDVALGPASPQGFDLVHLFNFATPELTERYARDAMRADVPFVVTTLCEDWPRFLAQSLAMPDVFRAYLDTGGDEAVFRERLAHARTIAPWPAADNAYTAANADCLLACGQSERRRLLRDHPEARRVQVVRFGADHAAGCAADPDLFRRGHAIADFVLCVGRLETRKNQLMLLKALEHDEVSLVFVTGDFTYQPEYAALCRRFPRRGRTLFLGRLPDEMLASAYAAARLVCVPSWYELPGLVALEAAGHGCPVVASRWGALEDYLGEAATYCEPDDPEGMRSAILGALAAPRTPALAERVAPLSWEAAGHRLRETYVEVTSGGGSPGLEIVHGTPGQVLPRPPAP